MIYFDDNRISLCINGYEKKQDRKNEEDSWANVAWEINSEVVKLDSCIYYMESKEIDELKELFKKFIDGMLEDVISFVPLEPAFKIRFYPNGDEYGNWFETANTNKLVKSPNVELLINFIENDKAISELSVSYILEPEEVNKFYNYLVEITK